MRRQDLYKEFIEEAASCCVHALQSEEPDVPALIRLYAKIDRMRVLSSTNVVAIAEKIGRKVSDTYPEPARSVREIRDVASNESVQPIRDSAKPAAPNSSRCELQDNRMRQAIQITKTQI